jgi:hypothetical protein
MAKKIQIEYDINGKPIDVIIDKTLNLKQAFRELTKEINKTQEGTAEFQMLSTKLGDVKDQMETTTAKSKDLFGSLSLLPGPVGMFAGSVDSAIGSLKLFSSFNMKDLKFQLVETLNDFKDIASNIGKATGITKIYTVLNGALANSFKAVGVAEGVAASGARALSAALTATGVGALVVAIGYLVGKIMEWASSTEEADTANESLNNTLKLQNDLIAKNAKDIENFSKQDVLRAKIAGKTEKEIYDIQVQANKDLLANRRKANDDAYAELQKFNKKQGDYAKLTEDQRKEMGKQLVENEKKTYDQITDQITSNGTFDLEYQNTQAEKARTKKKEETDKKLAANKQYQEKVAADNKTADQALIDLQRENIVLAEKDERKRQDKELENQKLAEEQKINELKISKEKKGILIAQIETKYKAKQADVDIKRNEEDLKAAEDFNKKITEIRISAIQNETERTLAEREQKYTNDLADLEKDKEFIKKSETEKAQIRKNLEIAKNNDINKIKTDAELKSLQDQMDLDQAQLKLLTEGSAAYFQKERDIEEENYQIKKKKAKDNAKELEKIEAEHSAAVIDIAKQEAAAKEALKQKHMDVLLNIASNLQGISSKEKGFAKAGVRLEEGVTLYKLWASDTKAIREAYAASPLTFGLPWSGIYAADLIAGTIMTHQKANQAIAAIDSAGSGGGGGDTGGAAPSQNLGRNYGDGGMIEGPRHAAGGVMINAEGGEAVMTRGAVTMFAPLLSQLNQMGGGTSFTSGATGGARHDNPSRNNPAAAQEPMIMKTYVVSHELTTEAEKQAKLKDLSTL